MCENEKKNGEARFVRCVKLFILCVKLSRKNIFYMRKGLNYFFVSYIASKFLRFHLVFIKNMKIMLTKMIENIFISLRLPMVTSNLW